LSINDSIITVLFALDITLYRPGFPETFMIPSNSYLYFWQIYIFIILAGAII